ncbi:hypothetical protein KAU55_04565, partial [Candidatus Bathyarchaeota archaeon]|nr:hypothetical protein [Candidatus Bathyarchaeota archaeon]
LRSIVRRIFHKEFEATQTPKDSMSKTVNLEHVEAIFNIKHSEEPVQLTTNIQQGQILYCAIHDLESEGFTEKEISEALQERGWNIPHSSLAPQLASNLKKQGLLIKLPNTRPTRYRLPSNQRINIID